MGLLGGGSLLFFSALVIAFAVAVNKSNKVNKIYESHVKEWLEWSEFLVTWVDAMSCVLAMVTFKIIKKWDAMFYDCFTPLSIWLESGYTFCLLIQLVFFIGEYSKNYAKISVECTGLGIHMSSIFSYVMLKSALDTGFDSKKADKQNLSALLFFGFSGFILIWALAEEGQIIAPAGKGFGTIALIVAVLAMGIQIAQISYAIYYRVKEKNFDDDSPDIAMVKLAAAVVKVLTQCYYCWLYTSKGYWDSPEKMPLALMTTFTLGYYVLVAFERFVGPSWFKALYDRSVSETRAACDRVSARYNEMGPEFRQCMTGIRQRWAGECEFWSALYNQNITEFAERRIATEEAIRRRWTAVSDSCKSICNRLIRRQVAPPAATAQVRNEQQSV